MYDSNKNDFVHNELTPFPFFSFLRSLYFYRGFFRPTQFITTCLGAILFPTSRSSIRVVSSAAFVGSPPPASFSSAFFVRAAEDDTCFSPSKRSVDSSNKSRQHRTFVAMSSNDELAKAQDAAPEEVTIFDKIAAGEIPCTEVYSDDRALAFRDVNPTAPVHILVIPKKRDGLTQLTKARPDQKELLGHLLYVGKFRSFYVYDTGFKL